MRILFVIRALPFPPKQGIDLPISHIIQALTKCHHVDLLVINANHSAETDFQTQLEMVPPEVRKTSYLSSKKCSSWLGILRELCFVQPAFFIGGFSDTEIQRFWELSGQRQYDWVWISPIGYLGFLARCRDLGIEITKKIALGYNDVVTTTYIDSLREVLSGHIGFNFQRFFQGLRTPWIWWHERRYLQSLDLVHVQTPLEVQRAKAVLKGITNQPSIVCAQNGRKIDLSRVRYSSNCLPRVLYMTHLKGGRAQESRWFLRQVWPRIIKQHPDAQLLLVGTPPQPDSKIARSLPQEAQVLGYVDDLVELYESVSVAVVPIIHSTGLINRALDALTAGVPLVATSPVLSTITGCQAGRDAIAADSAIDFANAVSLLLDDGEKRQFYSMSGRALARQQPTWQDSTDAIMSALNQLGETRAAIESNEMST